MRKVSPLLLAAVIALIATAARAETINFSFPLSPGSDVLTFQQFDDLGGTLTLQSVTIALNANVGANIEAENDSAIAGNMSVSLTGLVSVDGPGSLDTLAGILGGGGPVAVAATDGIADSGPDYNDFGTISGNGSNSNTLFAGLAPFIGPGTFNVTVNGSGGFAVSGVTDSTLSISNFNANGSATVTYVYTAVPEPSTFALGGLGLTTLILVARRRRRS